MGSLLKGTGAWNLCVTSSGPYVCIGFDLTRPIISVEYRNSSTSELPPLSRKLTVIALKITKGLSLVVPEVFHNQVGPIVVSLQGRPGIHAPNPSPNGEV